MAYLRWSTLLDKNGENWEPRPPHHKDDATMLQLGFELSRYYVYWEAVSHNKRQQQPVSVWWRPLNVTEPLMFTYLERKVIEFVNNEESRHGLVGYSHETDVQRKAVVTALNAWLTGLDKRYEGLYRPNIKHHAWKSARKKK